ncbi:sensor histidine kinase [Paenibacillus sp. MY03]|uniref:sensor histidine kinase n=1 Tax=Paenibacillus sp. MY03 TaxID=302980 RepID=UPI00211ADE7A|nr:histidine kinase [Paenibacillus sp. MY03]
MRPRTIYNQLLMAFLLVAVPLYVANLFINIKGAEQNKSQITSSLQFRVSSYIDNMEDEIERITRLKSDYVMDADLLQLSTISEGLDIFERFRITLALQKRLQIMQMSSSLIKNTGIFIPAIDRTITAYEYLTSIDQEWLDILSRHNENRLLMIDGRLFMSLPYPGRDVADKMLLYLLSIELSTDEIIKSMNSKRTFENEGSLLLDKHNNRVIANASSIADTEAFVHFIADTVHENKNSGSGFIQVENREYYAAYESSDYLGLTYMTFIPEREIMGPVRLYTVWFWILSITSIGFIFLFSYWIRRIIHRPLVYLVQSFRRMEAGDLQVKISHDRRDEFGFLYERFNNMINRLGQLIGEVYEQKINSQRAELKRLQSQINPHFLYNNHFILARLIKAGDNDRAYVFAKYIGEYLRYVTKDEQDEITLEQEFLFAKAYTNIQLICYTERVQIELEPPPPQSLALKVPRLILQPILENAFEHSLENKLTKGILKLSFSQNGSGVSVIIEDNGDELESSVIEHIRQSLNARETSVGEGTALINIHNRLRIKFGDESGIEVSRSSLGGLRVEVRISGGSGSSCTDC